ncbi:MAG: hypothetical protein ABI372_08515 [Ginsengibacter sp.]
MVFKNICPDKTEDDVSFQKWLRKQAVCVIVNHTRKNFRHQEIINFKHVPVANPGILWKRFLNKISPAFQKKPSNEIYSAISHLTPFSRIILNLMALEEFTYTDLSNCFDVTFDIAKENADLAVAEIKNIVAPFHAKVTC